ncbi:MAG: DEAD/DEAH box helicase [Firmicutes bacterium]|nr:DEAD/DEAH box helicase [Bacillota bacterium]
MAARRRRRPNEILYEYKGLVLDEFQQQSIWYLQRNQSTLVSAPTGTGKTLIADFLVEMMIERGRRLIYTAPIKALVNQKYREFARQHGGENIGIVTGDLSHNQTAPVVVMTTEILRNMLLSRDGRLAGTSWAVFDEIHYLDHPERGTVWEETILLLPNEIRILGLSATIPNVQEIAAWLKSIQRPVAVVHHLERAVPLRHMYFNKHARAVEQKDFFQAIVEGPSIGADTKGGTLSPREIHLGRTRHRRKQASVSDTNHLDLISYASRNRLFPCLYFVFSRRGCETNARELAAFANYLSPHEKETVRITLRRALAEAELTAKDIPGYETWQRQLLRGIGVHHAGLLPFVREITENLLERRLLRVIYATETFAVGVNMPVRTVCFDTLAKHDGQGLRPLSQQEYFQMAGRAGRRGRDRLGTVISRIDSIKPDRLPDWSESELEPIRSRLNISFNLVINLVKGFTKSEIERLLQRTLSSFQAKSARDHQSSFHSTDKSQKTDLPLSAEELFADFMDKWAILERLGYVDGTTLSDKGDICSKIYVQEVLITELLAAGLITRLTPAELAGLAAAIVYSPRADSPNLTLSPVNWMAAVDLAQARLKKAGPIELLVPTAPYPPIAPAITAWAKGSSLGNILKKHPLDPGDLVSICRQSIDLLRQMAAALREDDRVEHIYQTIKLLDRGVVRVNVG